MGCTASRTKMRVAAVKTQTPQERAVMEKIEQLANQNTELVSPQELELIRQTFFSLQEIDETRRNKWLEAIQDDILSPLYFSVQGELKYSNEHPFVPIHEKVEEVGIKDFPTLNKTKEELREYALYMYNDFIAGFNIDILKIQRLIFAVSENYQNNPFHNFHHGFCVTQMLYAIGVKTNKYSDFLESKDHLALLVSAMGHDLNHPGVTNAFMINSRHNLAIRYNDTSVLENYHAATLIQFLELSGCDIFSGFSPAEKVYMRKQIIPAILATDMAKHGQVMETFRNAMEHYNKENLDHKQAFIGMALHCADVGNPTLRFDFATVWSLRVIKEFNQQVWQEEQRGIPVSEFLRIGNDIKKIKQNQVGFIDMFILPLWRLFHNFVPQAADYVEAIENNRRQWELLEKLE